MEDKNPDTEQESVGLYPEWKQAAKIAAERFEYGDLIPFDWLFDNFNLRPPESGSAQQFQQHQFAFLESLDGFRRLLLEQHNMAIANVRGQGYRVLKPNEQTGYAMTQLRSSVRKEVRKAASMLQHIDVNLLSDDERRHNEEARGKLAALSVFNRKQLSNK